MKQIELELKKRLLIMEYADKREAELDLLTHKALPESDKTVICLGSELTEGITKKLVHAEEVSDVEDYRHEKIFIDYNNEDNAFRCGFESFISAIEAHGYYWGENPIGLHRPYFNDYASLIGYNGDCKDFDEAELKTFNPEKTLIFEILL